MILWERHLLLLKISTTLNLTNKIESNMNRKFFTTTNLWLECVDYYNRGWGFYEIRGLLHDKFYDYGMPEGASTSFVIDLHGSYTEEECELIADQMYDYLDYYCVKKN